jgi:hypothetical protein
VLRRRASRSGQRSSVSGHTVNVGVGLGKRVSIAAIDSDSCHRIDRPNGFRRVSSTQALLPYPDRMTFCGSTSPQVAVG